MKKIGYAIIGGGMMGKAHMAGIARLYSAGIKNLQVEAVCDLDIKKAKQLADMAVQFQGFHPRVFTDYKKMLEVSRDAVDICTMHESHHVIGCDCMDAGAQILVEKPLGLTIKAAKILIDYAEKKKKILATAENYRRNIHERMLAWATNSGLLGKIRMAILLDSSFSNLIVAGTSWRHERLASLGGHITDRGIHHADLFELCGGKIESVYATAKQFVSDRYNFDDNGKITDSIKCEVPDTCAGIYNFENGAIGMYLISCAGTGEPLPFRQGWQFIGSQGTLFHGKFVSETGEVYSSQEMTDKFLSSLSPEKKQIYFPNGVTDEFAIEINDFVESILQNREPEVSGRQGLRNMAVNYALCESAFLNRPVKIADVESGKIGGFQKEVNDYLGI